MDRIKGSHWQCLFSATLGFFIGFAAVSLFGPTAQKFKDVMGLTPVMLGFLVAIPSLSGSLLRIPFGAWVDTTGGRKPFIILLTLSCVGMLSLLTLVYFLYPDKLTISYYPLLLLLGILCGCGIATFSVGIGQVSYWFPHKQQGMALGRYAGIGNMAPGLFSLLLPISLAGWGLAGSYLAWLIFLGVGIIIYTATGKNACYFQLLDEEVPAAEAREHARKMGQEIFPSGGAMQGLKTAARIWKTWLLVAIYFTTFGGFIALTAWFPTYWTSFYGQKIAAAGLLTATFSLLASVVRIWGGSLSDRFGGERTLMVSLVIILVGSSALTVSRSFGFSLAGEIIMGTGIGIANAATFKLVPQEVKQAVGGAAGWVGGLGAFGGFAIPPVMGLFVRLYGNNGYNLGFSVFIVLTVISLILAYILHHTHNNSFHKLQEQPIS